MALVMVVTLVLPTQSSAQATPPPANAAIRHADSLFRAGNYAAALPAFEALAQQSPNSAGLWVRLSLSAANLRDYGKARDGFARAVAIDSNANSMYNLGAMHARLGNGDAALSWLDRAITKGFRGLGTLRADDDYATVRADARYAAAIARLQKVLAPCADDPNSRRFDFWIGDWDVRTVAGGAAGRNVIEKVSGGCALLENWTDAQGGTGKSLNAYNKALGQWQQYWVGQGGEVTEYRESSWNGPSLVYIARRSGQTIQRLTFTPVTADHVRQHGEISTDNGATWTTQYDLQYHRAKR